MISLNLFYILSGYRRRTKTTSIVILAISGLKDKTGYQKH
jgi:hypothetical protein